MNFSVVKKTRSIPSCINFLFSKSCTVKPVLSCHSKIDKTKTLMTNGRLMKAESIADCSPWSILKYF